MTNKRTITTRVLVDDGGMIVLGGLIEDRLTESESRVPLLGTIPVIGALFRSAAPQKTKTNLMVFIRPRVLRDGRAGRDRDQREVQLPARTCSSSGTRQGDADAGRRSSRRCRRSSAPTQPTPGRRHRQPAGALTPAATQPPPAHRAGAVSRRPRTPRRAARRSDRERQMIAVHAAEADRAVGRLPFAFAKRHGVLVRGVGDGKAQSSIARARAVGRRRSCAASSAAAELERVAEPAFDELLRKAYEGGSGEAGQIVEGIEGETRPRELAEELPEPADLLESEDDAPIIRLINALLTQAVKETPPTSTSSPSRPPRRALPRRRRAARRAAAQARGRAARWSRASRSWRGSTSPRSACRRTAASPAHRRPRGRRARLDAAHPATASAWCCACSTSRPGRLDLTSLGMEPRIAGA